MNNIDGCDECIFFIRMRRFLLTSETIDILCLVYSNFYTKKIIFKVFTLDFSFRNDFDQPYLMHLNIKLAFVTALIINIKLVLVSSLGLGVYPIKSQGCPNAVSKPLWKHDTIPTIPSVYFAKFFE